MATDQEKEVTATVEQPPPVTEEEVTAKPMEKPVKEKKPKAPKEKKSKQAKAKDKAAAHPPYFQMIKEALLALDEKSGSSPYAIAKFMEEKHKAVLPQNFKKILGLQLKNSAARGKLIKIRASYKLSEAARKEKETAKEEKKIKKPKTTKAATRSSTRKTRSVNKTLAAPKKPTAKVGAKKAKKASAAKPKQPKSIKSPAAKRSKKPSVTASAS